MQPLSQSDRPVVSVILPFFNAERWLQETIDSVVHQTFPDWELLLVNDGSTDGSALIAHQFARAFPSRIRYLEHPGGVNRGAAPSRNLGIRSARGDFIAPIDADDVWMPGKLAEQLCVFKAHPELALVCGATRYWSSWAGKPDFVVPTGHAQDKVLHPPIATLSLYPLGRAPSPCPSDLLIRRSIVLAQGGFEEAFIGPLQLYEDIAFLAKIFLAAPVYFSSQVWLNYRIHDDSCVMTVKRNGRYQEARKFFFSWFRRYIDTTPVDPKVLVALRRARLKQAIQQVVTIVRPVLARLPGVRGAANVLRRLHHGARRQFSSPLNGDG